MNHEILTYTLLGKYNRSDVYYETVEKLSDLLYPEIEKRVGSYVEEYIGWIKNNQKEQLRTNTEYALELLAMGVYSEDYPEKDSYCGIRRLENLVLYLTATREYQEEVLRLSMWLESGKEDDCRIDRQFWEELSRLTAFLDRLGRENLKQFIPNVESYRENILHTHPERKDIALVARKSLEYYLNMLGSQIMNQIFRKGFLASRKKYVFLPGCMTSGGEEGCKAVKSGIGYSCTGCTEECRVNKISGLTSEAGIKTLIVYHESQIERAEYAEQGTGIVGIACVTGLLSGGWKARRIGFIPQCVLLDYCGCRQHWSHSGIVTSVSIDRLKKILDI